MKIIQECLSCGKRLAKYDWKYKYSSEGDLTDFRGTEVILYRGEEVFRQNYCGGLIIPK